MEVTAVVVGVVLSHHLSKMICPSPVLCVYCSRTRQPFFGAEATPHHTFEPPGATGKPKCVKSFFGGKVAPPVKELRKGPPIPSKGSTKHCLLKLTIGIRLLL